MKTICKVCSYICIILFLQGCLPIWSQHLTQTDAIADVVHKRGPPPGTDPTIITSQRVPAGPVSLFTYDISVNGIPTKVIGIFLLQRKDIGWTATKGGFFKVDQPIQLAPFTYQGKLDDGTTFVTAGNLINDTKIKTIAATFDDGSREIIPVENGAFLVAKQDVLKILTIEALDAKGEVIRTETISQ